MNEITQTNQKKPGKAGKIVHLTAALVLLALAILAVSLTVAMGLEYLELRAAEDSITDSGDQFGNGIGQGFALLFMIIFAFAGIILSAISLILSSTVWRFQNGRIRTVGAVATVVSAIFFIALAILLLSIIIAG